MPKTYNDRQIAQLRREQQRAAPSPHEAPDVLRFIRFFPQDEIASIADRMEKRAAAGKLAQLTPETALLVVRALRQLNATPRRDHLVREICGVKDGCEDHCLGCIGKANAIMGIYEGRKMR